MDNTTTKGVFAAICFVFGFIHNAIGVFFIILLVAMAVDWLTGLTAAWSQGEASSKIGIMGILKKVCYVFLVLIALLLDLAILQAADQFGIKIPIESIFGILTIAWLFANEGISIIENLVKIGVPVPNFLRNGLKIFKDGIEKKNDRSEDNE